jgi:hypothetical protein
MRKLHLDPESLEVQSFSTAPAAPAEGTVRGHVDATGPAPWPVPFPGDSGCVATHDPCTCVPIETCSCGPDVPETTKQHAGWH